MIGDIIEKNRKENYTVRVDGIIFLQNRREYEERYKGCINY